MTASVGLKKLAKKLVKACKGVRPAAADVKTGHTLIDNWLKRNNENIDGLFEVLERVRVRLSMTKEEIWDMLTNGKK